MAVPFFFSSCVSDEDEVFDQPSSVRLEESLKETQKILMGAENGWLMDYYFGESYKYGGYAFFVKFDSLTCTAASELHGDLEATSYYKMTTDNGPVLSFDTYNDVLHELATPNQNMPEGYHADFEFTVMNATPELVTLRGKRTGNTCYLRPFNGDRAEYVASVQKMSENMIVSTLSGIVDGTEVYGEMDLDARSISFLAYDGQAVKAGFSSYTYTDKGIRLCDPLQVAGRSISEFAYDSDTDIFTALEQENNDITFNGKVPEGYVKFDDFAGLYDYMYLLTDNRGNEDTVHLDVQLIPAADKSHYIMKGFSKVTNFDVVVNYNKSKGCLMMYTQAVGTYNDNTVYLQAASLENGLAPGNPEFGMMTEYDQENDVHKWVTIPNDYFAMDSWCLWMLDGNGESAGQLYQDENWLLGTGQSLITDILWLKRTGDLENQ